MRILFLNKYYWPDSAATAQLLTDLAEHVAAPGARRCEVRVICSRQAYQGSATARPAYERRRGVHIHRVDAPLSRRHRPRSHVMQAWDMTAFSALALARATALPRPDVCVAMTSPPFVGGLGVVLRRLHATRLMLWLMDLYPDVAGALGAVSPASRLYRWAERAAGVIYRAADCIVTPDASMAQRLERFGVPSAKLVAVPNWSPNERPPQSIGEPRAEPFRVMYSGNLGRAHEFNTVLDAANRLRRRADVRFIFAGQGAQRDWLVAETRRRGLDNVDFALSQPLETLPEFLASADVHLVTLREDAHGMVSPSKLYGILSAGRPALFVGPSQNDIARTLTESRAGWTIAPGRDAELAQQIESLAADRTQLQHAGRQGRQYYEAYCTRTHRCAALERLIVQLADPSNALPQNTPPMRIGDSIVSTLPPMHIPATDRLPLKTQ